MRCVTRFESNLLRILQCLMGQTSIKGVLPILVGPCSRPPCLGRDAVDLVEQMIARGIVTRLTRQGAWTNQRFLRGNEISEGSLWERTTPKDLGLDFSGVSLDFLIWLTETNGSRAAVFRPRKSDNEQPVPTIGDQFFFYLASRALADTPLLRACIRSELFARNALIALTRPELFAEQGVVPEIDFTSWVTGGNAWLMESLQAEFRDTWVQLERDKRKIHSRETMLALGRVQSSLLDSLMDAAEEHGRRDLCRFLLEAIGELLGSKPSADAWTASLDLGSLRLAERSDVFGQAFAFLRIAPRLSQWHRQSERIGYFDEGYAESQLWKSAWESTGADRSIRYAEQIMRERQS